MNRNFENGVGLIEVLIALVVFALGVVGMAGLQLRTLSMSLDATQRSVVIAKSQDIADRIRSSGAAPSAYAGTYTSANCATVPGVVCSDSGLGNAGSCSAAQMAAFDVWDVFCGSNTNNEAESGLEGNVVSWSTVISCNSGCGGPGAQMTIATSWISRANDTDATVSEGTVTNVDGSTASAVTDQLTLSFIR